LNTHKVRWGILGTAQIARKNWQAIGLSGNATIVAVAGRDAERTRRFVTECQAQAPMETAPEVFTGYEKLLASDAVEAVYIPLPTGLRKEWVLRAAAAGKHIVCEKPCAVSVADLEEMLSACRRHGVQFMDGVMFMHSRRLEVMREALDDGRSVGQLRHLACTFSFCAPPEFFPNNIRTHSGLEPHGCAGDLGWYCIRLALWAMKWQLPRQVIGRVLADFRREPSLAPIPTEFAATLLFEGGVSASCYCSFLAENAQWANFSGARGALQVNDFVLPFAGHEVGFEVRKAEFHAQGCNFEMKPSALRFVVLEHSHSHPTAQESSLFHNFSNQIRAGALNSLWPEMALKTQAVMAACLESARQEGRPVAMH